MIPLLYVIIASLLGSFIAYLIYKWKGLWAISIPILFASIGIIALITASIIDTLLSLFFGIVAITFIGSSIVVTLFIIIYHKKQA